MRHSLLVLVPMMLFTSACHQGAQIASSPGNEVSKPGPDWASNAPVDTTGSAGSKTTFAVAPQDAGTDTTAHTKVEYDKRVPALVLPVQDAARIRATRIRVVAAQADDEAVRAKALETQARQHAQALRPVDASAKR